MSFEIFQEAATGKWGYVLLDSAGLAIITGGDFERKSQAWRVAREACMDVAERVAE